MLYDQAQLVGTYVDAYQITGDDAYAEVARGILDYVMRDMTSKEGGFYSAEDADSLIENGKPDHAEGAFYVWTQSEIEDVLGTQHAKWFNAMYGVASGGNAPIGSDPHGEFRHKNILIQRMSAAEVAKRFDVQPETVVQAMEAARDQLKSVRDKRPRPHLDDKVIAAWNGLMIGAFAKAAQVLPDADAYGQAAVKAASFIKESMYDASTGTLFRIHRGERSDIEGFLDDYAFLIQGLIDLYETDFDTRWLEWAAALQQKQDDLFWDEARGGYYATQEDAAHILLRMKDDYDGAEPSANSVALLNLLRLSHMLGVKDYQEKAETGLRSFSSSMNNQPSGMPQMLVALYDFLHPSRQIVFASDPKAPELEQMKRLLHQQFLPGKVVLLADGGAGQAFLGRHLAFIESVSRMDDQTTAYVCENYVCQRPTHDLEAFRTLLQP